MHTDIFEAAIATACACGEIPDIQMLINMGSPVNVETAEEYTLLMDTVRRGRTKIVQFLLSKGAKVNKLTAGRDHTPLTYACALGFLDIVKLLVAKGANMHLGALPPLVRAARNGHLDVVKYLLSAGANVDIKASSGFTALIWACKKGLSKMVELLVSNNADINLGNKYGVTPLMVVSSAGHVSIAKYLIQRGVDVNRTTKNKKYSALSFAVEAGHSELVRILLHHGANAMQPYKGRTLLFEAALTGKVCIAMMLIEKWTGTGNLNELAFAEQMIANWTYSQTQYNMGDPEYMSEDGDHVYLQ